jgi:predicted SnoaL-like aldol condensation-catalyzing enzyme
MKTPLLTAMVCIIAVSAAPPAVFAANTPEEAANKQLVLDFYRDIQATVASGKMSEMPKVDAQYMDPGYIQHSVNGQGAPGMQFPPGPPPKMGPPKLLSIMAEGDRVIQVTMRTITGQDGKANETIIFNLFRVKNGKLIEHWDAFGVPSTPPVGSSAPK